MGSKGRIASAILPFILEGRREDQWYVEPFVGGGGTFQHVGGKRLGADSHPYLVAMWQAVNNGWMPPSDITEEKYKHIRDNKELYPPELVGWAGFALSFGGKWWGGWSRNKAGRDYVAAAVASAERKFPKMRDAVYVLSTYDQLQIPEGAIVYCDPPYAGTTSYGSEPFNHEQFWKWCDKTAFEGATVYVSEYNAPPWADYAELVWEKPIRNKLKVDDNSRIITEKLFRMRP